MLGFQESTMKKPVAMTLALLLCSFIFAFTAGAVDPPHYDPATGNVCGTCHTVQLTLGSTGYNNICQNCHRPGNPAAGSKSITLADAANPFGTHSTTGISKMYQTSHRWDGSDTNPAAGAQPPIQGQMTTNGLRARTDGQLACVRCHNQHDNGNGSFLRVKNDKDQLCMDCHRSRNVQSHTQGSHPVNITYAEKYAANPSAFKEKPLNLNPANPTSSIFARISSAQGAVLCSTCHSTHFADSRSSTVDGAAQFANLSSGDGNLLRTDRRGIDPGARNDSANICSTCHAGKKSHNMKGQDIQCTDCHGAHVEYDQDDPSGSKGTNIYLIRRNAVSKDGHSLVTNGVQRKVFFRYTGSRKEYKTGDDTGICQSCHVVPAPDSIIGYPPEHASSDPRVCNTCHFHNSSNGSFSGACTACHGYPPTTANSLIGYARPADPKTGATPDNPGAHETHATGRHMACITCHTGYAAKAMPSNTIDIGFTINNSTYKNFVGTVAGGTFNATTLTNGYVWSPGNGTTLTTDNGSITCSVYCHGTTLTGGSATPPTWTITDGSQKACGACHGAASATAQTTGSHTRHAKDNAIACATCHGVHDNNDHVNGSVEWNFGALPGNGMYRGATSGGTGAIAPSASYGQCTNISCHSSGQSANGTLASLTYGSPQWGGTLGCGDCHKNMKTDTTAPGSHVKHAQNAAIACAACHNSYTDATVNTSTHSNGSINLAFSGVAAGATYSQGNTHPLGNGYGTCATTCHSTTDAPVTTPVWGTASTCSSCHDAAPATGAHAKHVVISSLSCGQCHNGAAANTSGGTTHINGTIEVVSYSASPVVKHAAGTYSGTCSTTCHSVTNAAVTTPAWGATSTCATCHDAVPVTGTHTKHLALSGVSCGQCHTGAAAGSNGGGATHGNGAIDVANSYSASPVAKHAAGSYTGTCSTSCHSATSTAVTTPVWGTASDCTSCHDASPTSGSHSFHLSALGPNLGCSSCHTGAQLGISAGASHYNGTIEVANSYTASPVAKHAAGAYTGTCTTTCHSPTTATSSSPVWGDSASCGTCHAVPPVTGSHDKHVTTTSFKKALCGDCHTGAVAGSSGGVSHTDNNINVAVGTGYTQGIAKHAVGTYSGTCSTVYCHSSGQGTANGTTAAPTFAPVAWGIAGPLACNACHAAAALASGSHAKHLLSNSNCGSCHTGATLTAYNATTHVDNNIDVAAGLAYTAAGAAGNGYGSCATNTCHNDGTTGAQVSTAQWGSPLAACTACHAAVPATGAHTKHVTTTTFKSAVCGDCHAGAVAGTNGGGNHLDGDIDVAAGGYAANTTKHAAGTYAGTCSAVYCHSSGQGTANGTTVAPTYSPVAWGTTGPLACNACHLSTTLASGSHAAHLASNTNCGNCHTGATATTYASTSHVNSLIDVAAGFSYTNQGVAGNGYSSCTGTPATGCHGTKSTPLWGANSSANASCTKCHGKATALSNYSTANARQAAPGYAQAAGSGTYTNNVSNTAPYGAHDAHVRAANGYTSRQILCSDCHGPLPSASAHANSTVDLSWSTLANNGGSLAPNYASGTCSANYCHGATLANGANTTPSWTGTAYLTSYAKTAANCGQCHGAPPTSSSFAHGGIAITNDCSGCHGHNGSGSTHIDGSIQASGGSCNGCHDYDTVGATWTGTQWVDGTWGKLNLGGYTTANEGWGAHAKHINYIKTRKSISAALSLTGTAFGAGEAAIVCGTCHTNSGTHNMSATDGSDPAGRSINFGDSTFTLGGTGSIVFGTPNPVYNGVSGTSSSVSGKEKTCSNISCHYFTTPLWSTY